MVLVASMLLICPALAQSQSDFVLIFDGQSFTNWWGDARYWSVQDGALRGKATDLAGSTFLIWQGEADDFELQLKFRIKSGNSGIQFRSVHQGGGVVAGYQADIAKGKDRGGAPITGRLFDEKVRTNRFLGTQQGLNTEIAPDGKLRVVGATATAGEIKRLEVIEALGEFDWHDYRVLAKGTEIILVVDGIVTQRLVDNDPQALKTGTIAFQMWGPSEVEFKDIRLKRLR